jgi:CDP-6-deoxy-D-xylo-4-hexulose-3-dehydrase
MKKADEIKNKILDLVIDYWQQQNKENLKDFEEGDRINYAGRVYTDKELCNLIDASLDFTLTHGKYCNEFEKEFSKCLNVKYTSLVNSGSSANLLAFMTLTSPTLKERQIKRGDEVITVATCFPTTVTPMLQYGAIPVFVDIEIDTLNIDVSLLEEALSDKTKAVFLAHTLGNPFDIVAVKAFCNKHSLWLISDECDALGVAYDDNYLNYYSDISTFSFFPAHHITTGEGGAVCTNNPVLQKIIVSMRDWGRDCSCNTGEDDKCGKRFKRQDRDLPFGYDHKYVYSELGYNLKMTEMQAAIGLAQLEKLNIFIAKRIFNFHKLYTELRDLTKYIILPRKLKCADTSPFGFYMTVKPSEKYTRNGLMQYLEDHNIQTRPVFAGNIIKQPLFEYLQEGVDYRVVGDLSGSNIVMNDTLWVGVYPGLTEKMMDYMVKYIREYFLG